MTTAITNYSTLFCLFDFQQLKYCDFLSNRSFLVGIHIFHVSCIDFAAFISGGISQHRAKPFWPLVIINGWLYGRFLFLLLCFVRAGVNILLRFKLLAQCSMLLWLMISENLRISQILTTVCINCNFGGRYDLSSDLCTSCFRNFQCCSLLVC
jgi:hypothetical protein